MEGNGYYIIPNVRLTNEGADRSSPFLYQEVEMSEEDIIKEKDKLRMVFRLFDTNRDGSISSEELVAVIRRYLFRSNLMLSFTLIELDSFLNDI